ncbi:MAG TPA: type II toxin-antitoxin system VapC family toxin [Fibrobacteria bacterium]|nr:type II toxin-antitoxin system VapC family toxin [Fibrobacteria bacterium]
MPKRKSEPSGAVLEARESGASSGFVLDTHALIWFLTGDPRLKKSVLHSLEAATTSEGLFIPAISIWEIGMLEAKGRISIAGGASAWVRRALQLPGLLLAPLHPEISLSAASLPDFHGDPADRMIVATSIYLGFPLATADQKIKAWGVKHKVGILGLG